MGVQKFLGRTLKKLIMRANQIDLCVGAAKKVNNEDLLGVWRLLMTKEIRCAGLISNHESRKRGGRSAGKGTEILKDVGGP